MELLRASGAVEAASVDVAEALHSAQRAAMTVEATAAHAPGSAGAAHAAIWAGRSRRADLPGVLERLAADLRGAYQGYLQAERDAHSALTFGLLLGPQNPRQVCLAPPEPLSWGRLAGEVFMMPARFGVGLVAGMQSAVTESLLNRRWTPSTAQTGYSLRLLTNFVGMGMLPPESTVHVFASVVTQVTTAGVSARVRVRQVAPAGAPMGSRIKPGASRADLARSTEPATTLARLVQDVGDLYPMFGAEPGMVQVNRMVAPDGSVAWQVLIPGTQSDDAPWGGDVPNDWASNLQIYDRRESAASAAVIAAMRAAGVRPGEPVMLAGHSQGGLVATDLAAREDVRAEFAIESIVSVGAPVGHIDIPDGVAALHLEHEDDLVAGVDDRTNPVTPERTTVTRNVTPENPWHQIGGVHQAHHIPAYVETARLTDASTDPAVRNWMAASAAMLNPEAQVTSTYMQARRVHD
ncbi:MAG TPA: hypothetical protein VK063_05065 [Beutenbergiaceae bacterium]|nr:hypothetical protein [Beutenbergiaceae bacterium]